MVRRFDPTGIHNGFFVAAFEKAGEGPAADAAGGAAQNPNTTIMP
jgi:hypothetical protein